MNKVSLNTLFWTVWWAVGILITEIFRKILQAKEDRIWRSAMEIYKSETTGEYFIERSGGDHHKYFGKVTAYSDYVFIIMNSNTFIRQRHFISRIKDSKEKLKNPEYKLHELHFISTCISFNQEPIALFEIFRKADRKTFISRFYQPSD
jgi:hypothetical protein